MVDRTIAKLMTFFGHNTSCLCLDSLFRLFFFHISGSFRFEDDGTFLLIILSFWILLLAADYLDHLMIFIFDILLYILSDHHSASGIF